jgi:hypothetical protein
MGHHLLLYADDVNLLGENINIIKKNIETPLNANTEDDPEVNAERGEHIYISCNQTTGQNHVKMWQSSNIWEQ